MKIQNNTGDVLSYVHAQKFFLEIKSFPIFVSLKKYNKQMIAPEKIFENYFDDVRITTQRFYAFSLDNVGKLTAANGAGDYTTLINLITPLITALGTELGDVSSAEAMLKGKTQTNDQVMAAFRLTMRKKQDVIADLFGGEETEGYIEFYPQGIYEYTNVTKVEMPTLTQRVKTSATTHSGVLGPALTTLLQGFKAQWDTSRSAQELQKGVLSDNRTERTDARIALELAMLEVIHTIAAAFPGEVEQCMSFFSFHLLFKQLHSRLETIEFELPANGRQVVANLTFDTNDVANIHNMDDNSNLLFYTSATADGEPVPNEGLTVKSNKKSRKLISQIGDVNHTFLIVKNLSAVNEGKGKISISGLDAG
jgi:hypothetical protein